jgi:Leucine-rich repeat (LRR) protein
VRLAKCQLNSPPPPILPDRTHRASTPPKKTTPGTIVVFTQIQFKTRRYLNTLGLSNYRHRLLTIPIFSLPLDLQTDLTSFTHWKSRVVVLRQFSTTTKYFYPIQFLTAKESEKDFLSLTALENLSLSHNAIEDFPTEIEFLHKLTNLSLDHNALGNLIYRKPKRQATNFKKPVLKYVDLSYNRIFAIAMEYEQVFQSAEKLDLSHNQLITIPVAITKLSKLKSLNMSKVISTNRYFLIPLRMS